MDLSTAVKNGSIRVMVVDDSMFMRKAIERILASAGDIEVVASVDSGEKALDQIDKVRPDLITMDVEMPGMGGLEAVKAITGRRRTPIIMLSSLTTQGTETTLRALEMGATDFIGKPSGGPLEMNNVAADLLNKIRSLAKRPPGSTARMELKPVATTPFIAGKRRQVECIAIGISTGGPLALTRVCQNLSADIRVPIIVVQHMPPGFTKSFAERLDGQCKLSVVEAKDEMPLQPGSMTIGVAGRQMRLKRAPNGLVACISDDHGESLYHPSADVTFASLAAVCGRSTVAFIMTGMGNDGTEGLKAVKAAGGYVYAQDEATSVVYGMPRSAVAAGVVDTILPLEQIAGAVNAAAAGMLA